MKEKKLTVMGTADPVDVVCKLRKISHAELISVGPAKEPEKKEEPKKEEAKREEAQKKEAAEKKKKEDAMKEDVISQEQMIMELISSYKAYNPQIATHYYVYSAEENPNSCVIC
ncbi:hypothetical protein AXF42_Ash008499 [Apostasia shenzhenica]|uniref:HMA domain-containing protein n=1 Tax=Apostasia shenzhenica TaxID=1088818 RepID=A0A2I0AY40_9ASPA|nr:hypothetical protein AXF42_Ash008499 [Apostasia shenzhenica]